jgi:hypothetical protein
MVTRSQSVKAVVAQVLDLHLTITDEFARFGCMPSAYPATRSAAGSRGALNRAIDVEAACCGRASARIPGLATRYIRTSSSPMNWVFREPSPVETPLRAATRDWHRLDETEADTYGFPDEAA